MVDAARRRVVQTRTGKMAEVCDDSTALWDPLREQDWESLGIVAQDNLDPDGGLGWDCVSLSGDSEMTSAPPSGSIDLDPQDFDTGAHRHSKVATPSVASPKTLLCSRVDVEIDRRERVGRLRIWKPRRYACRDTSP